MEVKLTLQCDKATKTHFQAVNIKILAFSYH